MRCFERFNTSSSWQRFFVLLFVSVLVFGRSPSTNFIYDEQEALLGSQFLLSDTPFWRLFAFDFWGRPPARTIGSYRPLVSLAYKSLAFSLAWHTPWFLSGLNLLAHAVVAWMVGSVVRDIDSDQSFSSREGATWGASLAFCCAAINTEAVCSVVGLADVMMAGWVVAAVRVQQQLMKQGRVLSPTSLAGPFLALTTLCCLAWWSKETAAASVLILPAVAWLLCSHGAPKQRVRWALVCAFASAAGAFVATMVRIVAYPTRGEPASRWVLDLPVAGSLFELLHLPPLPTDAMNNPLLEELAGVRLATAGQLFIEQFAQMLFPLHLVGDYSFPAQPVTHSAGPLWGALGIFATLLGALCWSTWRATASSSARLGALGLIVLLGGYAPIAQVLTLLPTIRAERLLYLPTVGLVWCVTSVLTSERARPLFWTASRRAGGVRASLWGISSVVPLLVAALICAQAVRARASALRYKDDLAFWRATSRAEPSSAKSHLNYGLMLGARGNERARLRETRRAVELAPNWPMGRLYLADTHCRRKELAQATPHYLWALSRVPQSLAQSALALQCLYEQGGYAELRPALHRLAAQHEGSWLDYLLYELEQNGAQNGGLPQRYRPRGYNVRVSQQVSDD